jgi:hypothetical protein
MTTGPSQRARAKQKNTTVYAKTADADLFKLHDKFCKAYAAMLSSQRAGGSGAGSLSSGTKEEKATTRKWERAVDEAMSRARAVIAAPALTLEGMLMKIHVAGFNIDDTKPGTFSVPYHGGICQTGAQHWDAGENNERDEVALIVSLRDDLHRFSRKRL